MTLKQICTEVAEIEESLAHGMIEVSYDNLMSAMKPGAPADLLDDILSMVGWDVFAGKEIETARVKEWKEALEGFKNDFQVEELAEPIKHITEYLERKTKK